MTKLLMFFVELQTKMFKNFLYHHPSLIICLSNYHKNTIWQKAKHQYPTYEEDSGEISPFKIIIPLLSVIFRTQKAISQLICNILGFHLQLVIQHGSCDWGFRRLFHNFQGFKLHCTKIFNGPLRNSAQQ